jgi:hypothetical protein
MTGAGLGGFATVASAQQQVTSVDLELQLLVDVSGSIDNNEFALQRDGYVNAFRSQAIKDAIQAPTDVDGNARIGNIAAQLIYWSGANQQQVAVDWTLIDSDSDSEDFATAIDNATRPFSGQTAPGSAIAFGAPLFTNNGFDGTSLVMDVSGDGSQNQGADTGTARNDALNGASGNDAIDRINGIAIGGDTVVESFYQNSIVGGPDGFFVAAANFTDFQNAIEDKIEAEVRNDVVQVPIPSTMLLLSAGLAGLGLLARRRSIV